MKKSYFPTKVADKRAWLVSFKAAIATHGAALGLLPGDIATLQGKCDDAIAAIDAVDAAKLAQKSKVAAMRTSLKDELSTVFNKITVAKLSDGYSNEIGQALGVIGPDVDGDLSNFLPDYDTELRPGLVRINFRKHGVDGYNVYARLTGQLPWTKLAMDTATPYDDTRPLATPGQPESREYYLMAVEDDEEVGVAGPIMRVVFGG